MKHSSIKLLFLSLLVSLTFASCDKKVKITNISDDPYSEQTIGDEVKYKYNNDVVVISDIQQSDIVDVPDENTVVFSGTATGQSLPEVGDIYVSMEKTQLMPNGFAGRVVGIEQTNGGTKIITEDVALDEIFDTYIQNETVDISDCPFYDADGNLIEGTKAAEDDLKLKIVPIKLEFDINENTTVTFTGSVSLGGKVDIDLDISERQFSLSPQIYLKIDAKATFKGDAGIDFDDTKVLVGRIPLYTVGIASITLDVFAYTKLKGELELSLGFSTAINHGFEWKIDHGESSFKEIEPTPDDYDPAFDISMKGTFDFGVGLREFFDIVVFQRSIFNLKDDLLDSKNDVGFKPLYGDVICGIKAEVKSPNAMDAFESESLSEFTEGIPFALLDNATAKLHITPGIYFKAEIENWFTKTFLKDKGKLKIEESLSNDLTILEFKLYPSFESWKALTHEDGKGVDLSCVLHRTLLVPLHVGIVLREKGNDTDIDSFERSEAYWLESLSDRKLTASFTDLKPDVEYQAFPYADYFGWKVLSDNPFEFTLAVDLGLSVMWATCDVGSSSPEVDGTYFAWGETEPKSSYNAGNYKYSGNSNVLPMEADAASVNWGGGWRMPTVDEIQELLSSCTFSLEQVNGKDAYKITSRLNGQSIILPIGKQTHWSSSIDSYGGANALYIYHFNDTREVFPLISGYDRENGYPVRAVIPKGYYNNGDIIGEGDGYGESDNDVDVSSDGEGYLDTDNEDISGEGTGYGDDDGGGIIGGGSGYGEDN